MATITERIMRAFGINKTDEEVPALLRRLESKADDGLYHIHNAQMNIVSWRAQGHTSGPSTTSQFWCSNHDDLSATIGDIITAVAIGISTTGAEFVNGKYRADKIVAHICDDKGRFYNSRDAETVVSLMSVIASKRNDGDNDPVVITVGRACDRYNIYHVND